MIAICRISFWILKAAQCGLAYGASSAGGNSERVIAFFFARNDRQGRGKCVIDARAPPAYVARE